MASFAPSYQQEGSEAWLNHIIGDILASEGIVPCGGKGRDCDEETIDARSESSRPDLERKKSDKSSRTLRSPLSIASSSRVSESTRGFNRVRRSRTNDSQFFVSSPKLATPVLLRHVQIPSSPAPPYSDISLLERPKLLASRPWPSHTVLEPTCDCNIFDKRVSEESAFSGFAPHPAVRPLQRREVLGEAAGRSEEDTAEYPGPLALSLIILGICLAVFTISLDRNVITTVSLSRVTLEAFLSL
jgi:hypothetical protein